VKRLKAVSAVGHPKHVLAVKDNNSTSDCRRGRGLGAPIPRGAMHIRKFENLVLRDRFKQCIIGEVPAFPMGFKADDTWLNMASFLTCCFANRANEPERKVTLNHTIFVIPFDPMRC
jgi:hypothetical protein